MTYPIYQVDSFTEKPFLGNPAAVVILDKFMDADWMKQVAREMNLSETAFVSPHEKGYVLQWFTPEVEVELCGHATLAAAHILWETGRVPEEQSIHFITKSGWLSAQQNQDFIELDFPSASISPGEVTEEVLSAVKAVPDVVYFSNGKWLFEYGDEKTVRNLAPDFAALRENNGRGLIVTAISDSPDYDFVSRYFAPWVGINEDPVTGSAHCILGPYWSKKLCKTYMTAYQASERGGIVKVRMSAERTYIGGKAVTIFSGELKV